jgi:hypothetical protein
MFTMHRIQRCYVEMIIRGTHSYVVPVRVDIVQAIACVCRHEHVVIVLVYRCDDVPVRMVADDVGDSSDPKG